MSDRPTGAAAAALRRALQRFLRQQIADTELRRALRLWVWHNKARGLRAEQLILSFNDLWTSIPDVQRASPMKQRRLRERLVSACIEEYYAGAD